LIFAGLLVAQKGVVPGVGRPITLVQFWINLIVKVAVVLIKTLEELVDRPDEKPSRVSFFTFDLECIESIRRFLKLIKLY
jgi:hypothetical protein